MNITCNMTNDMTPQEKEIYFAHMEKRHREEAEYMEARKNEVKTYKQALIESIMSRTNNFKLEELMKKPIRTLERIDMYC